jgi:hypothetical protein
MKTIKPKIYLLITAFILVSCGGEPKSNSSNDNSDSSIDDSYERAVVKQEEKRVEAEKVTKMLCDNVPKELILKYNPDGEKIEIEPAELIPGKLDHCKIKMFFGDKPHEFSEGRVSAWAPNMPKPLAQYDPNRNKALYQKVEGFGEKAVFISNTNQLLIIKDGLVYSLVPPNAGRITSTGMENKAIVLEMARHYKLNN